MSAPSQRPRASSGPTRHVYDVAIIGGQLSGAIAGALLARRGHHVLYVEHDGTGAGYPHQGYLLPYAPFVMPPLKSVAAFEEVLTELGLVPSVQRTQKLPAPLLQLALPDVRFDISLDPKAREKELKRALGDDAAAFEKFFVDLLSRSERSEAFFKEKPELPPEGFFGKMSGNRLAGRHPTLTEPLSPDAKVDATKLLAALTPFVSHIDSPTDLAATRPLSLAMHGLCGWPGGREGLKEMFLQRLGELGGDVLAHDATTVAEGLSFDGNKIVGVKLVKSDTIYRTSCVIGATDAGALRRLVSEKKKHRALSEVLDGATAKQILFSVNWVVKEHLLPRGMGELVMLEPTDGGPPILVQVQPARRAPGEPAVADDERVVCAGCFVPSTTRELGEDQLKATADRINAELDRLMPFTRARATLTSAPYLDASGVRGSRLLPHPLLSFEETPYLGITGLPSRAPVKHLFLASREVLPGLGFEGEVLAGLKAAKLVQETLKKADPLKKV